MLTSALSKKVVLGLLTCSFGLTSCSSLKGGSKKIASASISATKPALPGSGSIVFLQKGGQVEMNLSIDFPSKANQTVAVHIHEHGDCSNEGNGAHGHWNPTNSKHGKWGSSEFHLGDIGNVKLDNTGKGMLKLDTDKWSVGTGASNDVVGKGIIVHDGVDDFVTQPTGNAGSRIGCGVIALASK